VWLGTFYGTYWQLDEHFWNLMGTSLELEATECTPAPLLPSPKRTQKSKLSTLQPSYWLHEISTSKTVCHHFQPALVPPFWVGGYLIFDICETGDGSARGTADSGRHGRFCHPGRPGNGGPRWSSVYSCPSSLFKSRLAASARWPLQCI